MRYRQLGRWTGFQLQPRRPPASVCTSVTVHRQPRFWTKWPGGYGPGEGHGRRGAWQERRAHLTSTTMVAGKRWSVPTACWQNNHQRGIMRPAKPSFKNKDRMETFPYKWTLGGFTTERLSRKQFLTGGFGRGEDDAGRKTAFRGREAGGADQRLCRASGISWQIAVVNMMSNLWGSICRKDRKTTHGNSILFGKSCESILSYCYLQGN